MDGDKAFGMGVGETVLVGGCLTILVTGTRVMGINASVRGLCWWKQQAGEIGSGLNKLIVPAVVVSTIRG